MSLPKFVVLKSKYNNKYLRYRHECGTINGFLQFSGDEALSPYAKLEVVRANCGDGLVHLRCCFNNKFLARWTPDHWWIVAQAEQPEEDRCKWSSTLFRPVFDNCDPQTLRFVHVQLGHYACLWRCEEPYATCLFAGSSQVAKDQTDACTFVDWESLVPKSMPSIEIGSWGSCGGEPWSFEVAGGGITNISLRSADAVDALSFVALAPDGRVQSSPRFGGCGGNQVEIVLDWPREYLTSISGTHGMFSGVLHVITSLGFSTNLGRRIGPYGRPNGTDFALTIKRGAIVGFHGRSGSLIDAIGIHTRPC